MPINFETLVTSEKKLRKMFCEFYEHVIDVQKLLYKYISSHKHLTKEQFNIILAKEKQSNEYEAKIIDETNWIISKDMPRAAHLRYIIAVIRSSKDLERMSDFAFNVTNYLYSVKIMLGDEIINIILKILEESLFVVETIYKNIIFDNKQTSQFYVKKAIPLTDNFSKKYRIHFKKLGQIVFGARKNLNSKLGIFSAIKNIERNADHAFNILENFVFIGDPDFYFYRISRKLKNK